MARAGHHIDGRDTAGLRSLKARGAGVDAVEDPDVGLDRAGAVSPGAFADMAVRIDQAGHNDLSLEVDDRHIGGKPDGAGIADGGDLAVLDQQDTLLDRLPNNRDDPGIDKSDGFFLS